MKHLLVRLVKSLKGSGTRRAAPSVSRRFRPMLESLEQRQLLSAAYDGCCCCMPAMPQTQTVQVVSQDQAPIVTVDHATPAADSGGPVRAPQSADNVTLPVSTVSPTVPLGPEANAPAPASQTSGPVAPLPDQLPPRQVQQVSNSNNGQGPCPPMDPTACGSQPSAGPDYADPSNPNYLNHAVAGPGAPSSGDPTTNASPAAGDTSTTTPTAVVILSRNTPHDQGSMDAIATTLNTTVTEVSTQKQLLDAFKDADVIYVTTHSYNPDYHVLDRMMGRRGLQVDDTAWSGRAADDVVTASEIQQAMKDRDHPPDLVIINACRGERLGLNDAFGAKTLIDYKGDDRAIGPAGDSYFKNLVNAYVNQGKTIQQAKQAADAAAASGTFGEVGVSKAVVINGDPNQTYKKPATPPAPGAK
jgi:hypothetical protein